MFGNSRRTQTRLHRLKLNTLNFLSCSHFHQLLASPPWCQQKELSFSLEANFVRRVIVVLLARADAVASYEGIIQTRNLTWTATTSRSEAVTVPGESIRVLTAVKRWTAAAAAVASMLAAEQPHRPVQHGGAAALTLTPSLWIRARRAVL